MGLGKPKKLNLVRDVKSSKISYMCISSKRKTRKGRHYPLNRSSVVCPRN